MRERSTGRDGRDMAPGHFRLGRHLGGRELNLLPHEQSSFTGEFGNQLAE